MPLHPALVHFPIAFWLAALIADAAAWWSQDPRYFDLATDAIGAGLLMSIPAIGAGAADLRRVLSPQGATGTTLGWHLALVLLATTAYLILYAFRTGSGAPCCSAIWLPGNLGGAALLVVGAHYGAKLVYRHGVGVARDLESNDREK